MGKCYSTDNENFCHARLGDVLYALKCEGRLEVGTVYYEAFSQPVEMSKLLRADLVLEQADDVGYDLIGESWDSPFSVSKEAEAELQLLLDAWAEKHVDIGRYYEIVGNTRELRVTEADLPANTRNQPDKPR